MTRYVEGLDTRPWQDKDGVWHAHVLAPCLYGRIGTGRGSTQDEAERAALDEAHRWVERFGNETVRNEIAAQQRRSNGMA